MPRTTPRALSLAALAVVAVGVLAGCGDDSTAAGTPTLLSPSSPAAVSPPPEIQSDAGSGAPAEATRAEALPGNPGQAATAPPETPQAMPSGFPGPAPALMGEKEEEYLDELESEGVEYSGNGESAVVIANYVCAAKEADEPAESVAVNVGAMAGVEQTLTGGDMDPAEAGQIYIDVANSAYCP